MAGSSSTQAYSFVAPVLDQVFLGGAHQEAPGAAAGRVRVHVDVEIALAGLRAVVREADLGRADDLAVLLARRSGS